MLENFYQNKRRYDRSRDENQLLGGTSNYLSTECEPYRYQLTQDLSKVLKTAPCGAVANSLFNDTFTIYYNHKLSNNPIKLNISKKDLAWSSDRKFKFRNPANFIHTVKPVNWHKNITQLENGFQNEDLMVWMRTAAFPTFKKLYGRILLEENSKLAHKIPIPMEEANHTTFKSILKLKNRIKDYFTNKANESIMSFYNETEAKMPVIQLHKTLYRLPKGQYFIDIEYNYMIKQINGRKFFILANVSWIGGRCNFLAISYIVVGCLCFMAAIVLFFIHIYHGNMDFDTAILMVDPDTGLIKHEQI